MQAICCAPDSGNCPTGCSRTGECSEEERGRERGEIALAYVQDISIWVGPLLALTVLVVWLGRSLHILDENNGGGAVDGSDQPWMGRADFAKPSQESLKAVKLTMAGSIAEYDDTMLGRIKSDIAEQSNCLTEDISLTVAAGSVVVTALMPNAGVDRLVHSRTSGQAHSHTRRHAHRPVNVWTAARTLAMKIATAKISQLAGAAVTAVSVAPGARVLKKE